MTARQKKRPVHSRTIIVLPTEPWLTRELLTALLLQAKKSLVLVASRTLSGRPCSSSTDRMRQSLSDGV